MKRKMNMRKNMKKMIIIMIASLNMGSAFAGLYVNNGRWTGIEEANHFAWNTPSCKAATFSSGKASTLEVYAEKRHDGYIEPTVQIVTTSKYVDFYRADMQITSGGKVYKTELYAVERPSQNTDSRVAIVKMAARKDVIELLKSGSQVDVSLYNKNNNWVRKITYYLTGSRATIDSVFNNCHLGFNEIEF